MNAGRTPVVVLDRIDPGRPKPLYCLHGRTPCMTCDEWCWLGSETYDLVVSGHALPMCQPCATLYVDPLSRIDHIDDHRRDDGPHGTSGGVQLTDELIQRAADDAERGYDPTQLRPRDDEPR